MPSFLDDQAHCAVIAKPKVYLGGTTFRPLLFVCPTLLKWGYPSMKTSQNIVYLVLATGLICCPAALAKEAASPEKASQGTAEKEWYYGPTKNQPETKSLGRQKAELRARQRLARMESMRWYGFSASRPTAAGIPFTTMYAPAWTRPGNRPFAWYTSQRPTVIVSPYYPSYHR